VDIAAFLVAILLACGVIVLGAAAIALFAAGFMLLIRQNTVFAIPYVPFAVALCFALAMFALSVLTAIGTMYYTRTFVRTLRVYQRWHKNTWASANGRPVYPQLSIIPLTSGKLRRRLRTIVLIALAVFMIDLIVGWIIAAITSGSFQFWHAWDWFI